jgi:hypothetical protein
MRKDKCNRSKKRKHNMKKEDTLNLPKLRNYKLIKIDLNNNMIEDNFNTRNKNNNQSTLKKKSLEEFYPNNI